MKKIIQRHTEPDTTGKGFLKSKDLKDYEIVIRGIPLRILQYPARNFSV
jgi:hypothetical protein